MTKAELVTKIATKCKLNKAQAERAVNGFVDVVKEAIKKGDKLRLVGFGTFSVTKRKARTGKNHSDWQADEDCCEEGTKILSISGLQKNCKIGPWSKVPSQTPIPYEGAPYGIIPFFSPSSDLRRLVCFNLILLEGTSRDIPGYTSFFLLKNQAPP